MPQGPKNDPNVARSVEFEFERELRELEVELVLKFKFELERELELELRLKTRTPLAGNCRHAAAACDAATLLSLPVDDCGHDDGGLCSEAWGRFEARGPLVYIAGLVGSHTPWAHKRRKSREGRRVCYEELFLGCVLQEVPKSELERGFLLGGMRGPSV